MALLNKDVTYPFSCLCRIQLIHFYQLPPLPFLLKKAQKYLMGLSSVKKSLQVCICLHMYYLNYCHVAVTLLNTGLILFSGYFSDIVHIFTLR